MAAPTTGEVEGQPLAANVDRVISALEYLGAPLEESVVRPLRAAAKNRDAAAIQAVLDRQVLLVVSINPELRVKVVRGPGTARIQQHGYTPVIVKVMNEGVVNGRLNISSPQAGSVFDGVSHYSLQRQQQTELNAAPNTERSGGRFTSVELFRNPPMTPELSGLRVEYVIALIASSESGLREATIGFDVGTGTQDLGFRGEVPVLFDVAPAVAVKLSISDADGKPTTARLTFRDHQRRVFPLQSKRVAPDLFFQPHIYRNDGETVLLPPGTLTVSSSRGPEYVVQTRELQIPAAPSASIDIQLTRWVDPMVYGFYCGDHHIHGAGCAHYEFPTEGVSPADMFRQVKGEGLNIGCVLTWGPCFDFQRRYFSPVADVVSEPLTRLKYDLEISGFGSAAMGHVCLLNLQDQTYPGTDGTTEGWPSWTVPVLRWAKQQGGVTGFPHSAMGTDPTAAAQRQLAKWDADSNGSLSSQESMDALLPEPFEEADISDDDELDLEELSAAANRASDRLPNLVPPAMSGSGAMEIVVAVPEGVCDFISAMDTERISEWNTWYHLLNCGFPIKLSGETDFPCMSSRRVGQGRVYVHLGDVESVDFTDWCNGIAAGRSYVSDGYAHALKFSVNGQAPGGEAVSLSEPATVHVEASVAFAREVPEGVAYGSQSPPEGRRAVGDTRILHGNRTSKSIRPGNQMVEVIINGQAVESLAVPADGAVHDLAFDLEIERSSWVALRQFPQLHTNPVNVIVSNQPVRASRDSAQWCHDAVELLWKRRNHLILEQERPAAYQAYERAKATYRRILNEAESSQ